MNFLKCVEFIHQQGVFVLFSGQATLKGLSDTTFCLKVVEVCPVLKAGLRIQYPQYLVQGFKICTDIFNWKPPKHMFYELFLDEDGTKISKSKGEAINPTTWLKYGTLESLYYLFFNKPRSAKRVS